MHLRAISLNSLVFVLLVGSADAATLSFRATKKDAAWDCANASKPDTVRDGLIVNVQIDAAPEPAKVLLSAKYSDAGASKEVAVPHSAKTLWRLEAKDAKPDAASPLTVSGTIDGVAVTCTGKVEFVETTGSKASNSLPASTRFTNLDARADTWLQSSDGKAALASLVDRIVSDQEIPKNRIVVLKHLPSGAVAFPYPSSVSEHQVMQIVIVVNMRDLVSAEATFTSCERPLRERLKGDFGAFAAKAEGTEELAPDFALKPIGSLFQCGPETMAYSISVTSEGSTEKPTPAPAKIEVRPVYHLGATALMGFDMTTKPTFGVKSGVVTKTDDRFGPSLYLGGTWYPFGVDYGKMRWWNYAINPVAAVSLDNPKENFVVGNAFTITGGISLAVGAAFHKVDELDGIAEGAAFTGDGNVPTVKKWSEAGRGWFVAIAVDNNFYNALKKIKAPAAPSAGK